MWKVAHRKIFYSDPIIYLLSYFVSRKIRTDRLALD